ncbi:hypothetical protein JKP88DRAFT_245946 [Tribonema minus]|uniref:Pentatricopeptide repeat-containing protein n=1 Tax=Tribonema minus TaxID=303371 RepID=A0A836CDS4_9STRA|nr:hypothetical protein JKP88DRAFT_245946 [Tribonema minus]
MMRKDGVKPTQASSPTAAPSRRRIHVCACAAAMGGPRATQAGASAPWRRALALLRELEAAGLVPDRVVLNSVMAACAAAGRWQEALRLLKRMGIAGGMLAPDIVSYNTALSACSRARAWDAASRVIVGMRNAGLEPSLITFNTRMAQCQRSGHFSDALVLLDEMRAAGVQPDAVTYTALLWTVGQAPAHTHPRPGPRQWECLTHAAVCVPAPAVQRCVAIVDDMQARGIPRTTHVYTAAMTACKQAFAYKALLRLEEDRVADAVPADDAVQDLVAWATEQQDDEHHRLYP